MWFVPGRVLIARSALACGLLAVLAAVVLLVAPAGSAAPAVVPPPANAGFDYQIGGDYPLPTGVNAVSRDWFSGKAAAEPTYSVCYVNAFQTQANEPGTNRPDEQDNWPKKLILSKLGDDPHWGGEYLVDISTKKKRRKAARWVRQMIEGCAEGGFEAVEFDNLDSWTRFNGTPLAKKVPFGKPQALAFAKLLAKRSHALGLAVGQKNAAGITKSEARDVGFDFAVAEECAHYRECDRYTNIYGGRVIEIEYRRKDFEKACADDAPDHPIVLRDKLVSTPNKPRYVFDLC
jgi:hypothetical protein